MGLKEERRALNRLSEAWRRLATGGRPVPATPPPQGAEAPPGTAPVASQQPQEPPQPPQP